MKRKYSWLLMALPLLLVGSGCVKSSSASAWPSDIKPKILVTFPALYSAAAKVAGDDAHVKSALTGQGPHGFKSAGKEMLLVAKEADLVIANGLGLDDKITEALQKSSGNKKWRQLTLGKFIPKEELREGACQHEGPDHSGHEHGDDPHTWLNITFMKRFVSEIAKEMSELDPAHAEGYKSRATAYIKELDELEAEGQKAFVGKTEEFISSHDSLNYFAATYYPNIYPTEPGQRMQKGVEFIQIGEHGDLSPKHMNKLIDKCKTKKIRVIAVEPQFPNRTAAKTILESLQKDGREAVFAEVDPLETADEKQLSPDLYVNAMRMNFRNLSAALK